MSGHSKWHKVKHRKAATDSKKGKLFGQLARDIKSAARSGSDPAKNSALREAIERARAANLPQANIDRLLHHHTAATQEATYEGYGPGGVALLIQTATDNTNRTVSEVRSLLKEYGGSLGKPGSVRWKFQTLQQPYQRISVAADDLQRLSELLNALATHPDITAVFTDATDAVT